METGYPRFFVHRSIQKLAAQVESKLAKDGERTFLYPTASIARRCRAFMQAQLRNSDDSTDTDIRIAHFRCAGFATDATEPGSAFTDDKPGRLDLFVVLFPSQHYGLAKSFWQHSGLGISSRLAERCLTYLHDQKAKEDASLSDLSNSVASLSASAAAAPDAAEEGKTRQRSYGRNRHYSRQSSSAGLALASNAVPSGAATGPEPSQLGGMPAETSVDHEVYVEERYGRNLPEAKAELAKCALRRRIAGTLVPESKPDLTQEPSLCPPATGDRPTVRVGTGVTESDVYLFPTGMSAIFTSHQLVMEERRRQPGGRVGKSICFGFPYLDTYKILQKWGPGCTFLGNGREEDIEALEAQLKAEQQEVPVDGPTLALFCEFPSNPLLRSPNLRRIRQLADQYNFLVVVDETIGNFVNVEVLPFADIVVSSLTKIFSGESNVMGGSLVLNPNSKRAGALRAVLDDIYEDTLWDEDAIFMERNSRDFVRRVRRIDSNAQTLCKMLHSESQRDDADPDKAISAIYYPLFETPDLYEACRRKDAFSRETIFNGTASNADSESNALQGEGYGGLFSIFFTTPEKARAFYDALRCHKGPSLGTNFTIASPYAVLAHYTELDWAKGYGVDPNLVRISVGLEAEDVLMADFSDALLAARSA
ncbi:Cystathionine gamma-synthase [Tilletia horrida]|nr:Cystathionine gamma-synthase [Tilletia horrida]